MGVLDLGEKQFARIKTLEQFLSASRLTYCVITNLDFSEKIIDWDERDLTGSLFLGCQFSSPEAEFEIRRRGAHLFPKLEGLPYNPYQPVLYYPEEFLLLRTACGLSQDALITRHYNNTSPGFPNIIEALSRRLHDYSIDEALREFILDDGSGQPRKIVGFMGGHEQSRDSSSYHECAQLAWTAARRGFTIVTGGGPGIMEAANMGAYMSPFSEDCLHDALELLASAPEHVAGSLDSPYIQAAISVRQQYPSEAVSLSVPTWLYAQEQNNIFAAKIAKYFANSIREEGLTSLCNFGIVFLPGGPGTIEEVFMDANNNFYSVGFFPANPMILFGSGFFSKKPGQNACCPVWDVLKYFKSRSPGFGNLLLLSDCIDEVIDFLVNATHSSD
jgi:predicted Rossmann-fold nucleotide-binding protein